MPDLKAAAKRLRSQVCEYRDNYYLNSDQNADSRARHEVLMSSLLLAAQALEAWAWMAEKELCVERFDETWRCFDVLDANYWKYRADTPLDAVLAAMEGEKDGK